MTFAAAAFLVGLAALALPWWLHRRRTHAPDPRVVGSLLLMRASEVAEHRHRVLRHRLLLACRWLLLVVLVLAFAQPMLQRAPGVVSADARMLPRLIVMDTSLSMSAATREARATARALIDELPPGGRGAVVGAASELTLLAPLGDDHGALRAAVEAASPGAGRLAFDGLLERLGGLAGTLGDEPMEIHLISDFQSSAMPPQFNALVATLDHAVVLHPLALAADNWRLTVSVAADQLVASVRSFAGRARAARVVVNADGVEIARRQVNVAPGDRAHATFPLPSHLRGGAGVQVRIEEEDAVAGDDVAYAVINAREPVPLPLVAGAGAADQAAYLRTAIEAAALRFEPAPADARGPVAVLLDPGALDAGRQRWLDRHLQEGGALLLFAGPATQQAGHLPVLGMELVPRRLTSASSGVAVLDRAHPVLAGAASWRDVRVFQHVAPQVDGDDAQVLLSTDDGAPLLLEMPLPAGRALVLTTALDPQWSTLVASPAFVSFVADALTYLAEDLMPAAALAGQPVAVPAANLQVFDAAGDRLLSLQDTVGRAGVRLEVPGVYTLRTPSRARLLAVNPDPRESDLAAAPAGLLERWQSAVARREAVGAAPPAQPVAWPLAPWLLLALLALGALEALSANMSRPGGMPA